MAELPVEVTTELLTGLPVKSLLRFRCVSKRWRALIDGQSFVKSHLRRSLEHKRLVLGGNGTLHFLNLDDDFSEIVKRPFLETSVEEACFTSLLGSCDGLVLIGRVQRDEIIYLLNPSTQNYVDLPFFPVKCPGFDADDYDEKTYYGLGYDSVNDDYKVVRIVEWHHLENGLVRSDTMVYSLKSNIWKKVRDFPYCLPERRPLWGANVGGVLHTTSLINDQESIVGFDLSTEGCCLVQLPEDFNKESKSMHVTVTVLGGCLCLLGGYIPHRTDVWLMKDYGVMQSWMKLFSVAPPTFESYFSVVPLVYSRDGSEVLLNYNNKKLIWYDWRAESVRDAPTRCLPENFYAAAFVESLVPIRMFDVVKKQPGQAKPKEKKEKPKRDGFLSKGFKLKL